MKKILYSIFALSTLLFTATSCTEDTGTTTEVADANADENVNPNHIRGYGDREPGGMPPSSPEADQMYGFNTEEFSQQVSSDLDLEGEVADEMVRVYYDRGRQLSELEQRFQSNATTRSGGQAADNANAGTSGNQQQMSQDQMDTERQRIDDETDQKVKEILTPEQYRKYQQNRSRYNTTTTGANTSGSGASGSGNQTGRGTRGNQ